MLSGDQLSGALTDTENSQHGVDCGHLGEDTGVSDTDGLETADLQLGINDSELVFLHVTHLGGTGRVVHGVSDAATVLGELLVGLQLRARSDLALDPVLEGCLLSDLAGGLETSDDSRSIVSFRIGEVAEVQRRLDVGVGRGKVDAAARARTRDVGCHAEGIDGRVVA